MPSPYRNLEPGLEVIEPDRPMKPGRRRALLVLILSLTAISIAWRLLAGSVALRSSSLIFVGLPALLAVSLAYAPVPGSTTGRIIWGITFFLLMIGILLIEGLVCIVMAAPLFYLMGAFIGWLMKPSTKENHPAAPKSCAAFLLLMSLEGTNKQLSFEREEQVTITRELTISVSEARRRLSLGPDFDLHELPLFLKAGFPLPQDISGHGLAVGSEWTVAFQGKESLKPLSVRVEESSATGIRFRCVCNESKIGEWIDLQEIHWELSQTEHGCLVTLTFTYDRLLDPAWYFAPLERYGVKKAGGYFIDQVFRGDDTR